MVHREGARGCVTAQFLRQLEAGRGVLARQHLDAGLRQPIRQAPEIAEIDDRQDAPGSSVSIAMARARRQSGTIERL